MADELWKLEPIGNGSAFNKSGSNTSWYLLQGKSMYIFDMPYSNLLFFQTTQAKKILANVEELVIFITHMHEDHVGGLVNFSFLTHFQLKKKIKTFVPTKLAMQLYNYVSIVGGDHEKCGLLMGDYYQDENVQIFPRSVAHVPDIPCFAYVVYGNCMGDSNKFISKDGTNWGIYYSGDNKNFMDEVMIESFMDSWEYKMIYHDMTFDVNNDVHCYYQKITKVLKPEQRSHVIAIHLDSESAWKRAEKLGLVYK